MSVEDLANQMAAMQGMLGQMQQQVVQADHRAQQAEVRATAIETTLAAATPTSPVHRRGAAAAAPTGQNDLVDTRLLSKPKPFNGSVDEWAGWAFKMLAYLSALDGAMSAELAAAVAGNIGDVRNSNMTMQEQARSRQLYFVLVLLLEGPALQLVKPVGTGEGYRAWRMLHERFEPDRPGRHAGQLQELIGYQFQVTNLEASLAEFEYKTSRYEDQSGERVGDKLKIAILQKGILDGQIQGHLILHAGRLITWELVKAEVLAVVTTRQALASCPGAVPMDIGYVGKKQKGKGKDKDVKGKWQDDVKGKWQDWKLQKGKDKGKDVKGKWQDYKGKGSSQKHDRNKDQCFYCHKPGHQKKDCRKRAADIARGIDVMTIEEAEGTENPVVGSVELAHVGIKRAARWELCTVEVLDSNGLSRNTDYPLESVECRSTQMTCDIQTVDCRQMLMVDSGAARSVCPMSHGSQHRLKPSSEEVTLVGADGREIPAYGERMVGYRLEKGGHIRIKYTAANVRKPVVSVSHAVRRGMSFVFAPSGSYMVRGDVQTDCSEEKIQLERHGDLFFIPATYDDNDGAEIMAIRPAREAVVPDESTVAAAASTDLTGLTAAAAASSSTDHGTCRS